MCFPIPFPRPRFLFPVAQGLLRCARVITLARDNKPCAKREGRGEKWEGRARAGDETHRPLGKSLVSLKGSNGVN